MAKINTTNRKFGIELEFSRQLMNCLYHERDKNPRWQELNNQVIQLMHSDKISRHWKFAVDTSCGGEIVTPPMSTEKVGFSEIAKVCQLTNEMAMTSGYPAADAECGLHVHFDAADLKPRHIGNMFAILYKYEPVIYSIYTMRNPRYCAPISVNMAVMPRSRTWEQVRDAWYRGDNNVLKPDKNYPLHFINSDEPGEHHDGTRYHGFNIHCYWRQRTVEFRYGRGTFDVEKIHAFYKLCAAIVNKAIKMRTPDNIGKPSVKFSHHASNMVGGYKFRQAFIKMCTELKLDRYTVFTLWEMAKKNNNADFTSKDPSKVKIFVCDSNRDKYAISIPDGVFDLDGNWINANMAIIKRNRKLINGTIRPVKNEDEIKITLKVPANISLETNVVIPEKILEKYKNKDFNEDGNWVKFLG